MTILSEIEINELMKNDPPLVEGMIDSETQIQVNGCELTIDRIFAFDGAGTIAFDNSERVLPDSAELAFDDDGWIDLPAGCYKIVSGEIVHIPKDVIAIARPRSSLLRCGASVETAVWDSGYEGKSECLLLVANKEGFRLKRGARVVQLLFMGLASETAGYSGVYQGYLA
ncbi:MAG: deoxyuridine 5'-triphosphate nucleotidohydrolase [Euryarchaeota archaeon]|nr:MAG: Deoxyuridine 5'-triphosphate nucleotidohydrolase [ANME-2 cluster archaeon]MEA1865002.1 deoxyuridine 5'-triphosphate nucleotidohydrolase [Euryarchaeota archaeon]